MVMGPKFCNGCKTDLSVEDFYTRTDRGKQRLRTRCKKCSIQHVRQVQADKMLRLRSVFGGACFSCGYSKCLEALEFHHNGNKEGMISWMTLSRKYEVVLAEARKCQLLCANCHREHHAQERRISNLEHTTSKISETANEVLFCSHCKYLLPKAEFSIRKRGLQYVYRTECKRCFSLSISRIIRRKRTEVKLHFGGRCTLSGYSRCLDAFEFHHIEKKESTLSQMYSRSSYSKILKEAEKCQLICANCHREHHAGVAERKKRRP
jgi:hypothetical protein